MSFVYGCEMQLSVVDPITGDVERHCVVNHVQNTLYLQYVDEDARQRVAISDVRQYSILGGDAYWAAIAMADPEWMRTYYVRVTGWDEHDGILDLHLSYNYYSNEGLLDAPPRDETATVIHRFIPLPLCPADMFVL